MQRSMHPFQARFGARFQPLLILFYGTEHKKNQGFMNNFWSVIKHDSVHVMQFAKRAIKRKQIQQTNMTTISRNTYQQQILFLAAFLGRPSSVRAQRSLLQRCVSNVGLCDESITKLETSLARSIARKHAIFLLICSSFTLFLPSPGV
jgi:hypothetical protein